MLKLRQNNRSLLVAERAKILFNRIRREAQSRDKKDIRKQLERIYQGFQEFYTTFGKPSVQLRPFDPKQMPKSAQINATMAEIEEDLDVAYKEARTIGESFIEVFNYSTALSQELESSAQRTTSAVVDLKILNGQFDQNLLIAGDDFVDLSKVDTQAPVQNPRADVSIAQGIATLAKLESINLIQQGVDVSVKHTKPDNLKVQPTVDNTDRFYEGNFFNFIGSARPEGGRWHLEEALTKEVAETGISTRVYLSTQPQNHPLAAQNWVSQGGHGGAFRLNPEDIIVFDRGASEGERQTLRAKMVDANPTTFWECEYVKTYAPLQQAVERSRELETLANSNQLQVVNGQLPLVTINDLRSIASLQTATISTDDLEIEIVITLASPQQVNWISLNPNNFEETAWLEVLDVATAEDTNAGFRTIPGFENQIFDNTITDYANAELTEDEAKTILAPNRYAYRGIGVWNFESVLARRIKIKLRQKVGVPNAYQRLAIRLHRVIQQTYTRTESDDGMGM